MIIVMKIKKDDFLLMGAMKTFGERFGVTVTL